MKIASVNEIKQELDSLKPAALRDLCVRLARYKKENKELLTYLLFDAHDEQGYTDSIKEEIDREFEDLPKANLHLTKKSSTHLTITHPVWKTYRVGPESRRNSHSLLYPFGSFMKHSEGHLFFSSKT